MPNARVALAKLPRTEQWAERICAQLGKSIESIIEAGRLLSVAKAELPHGEWARMFERGMIPLSQNTAGQLMKIAAHPQLSNSANSQNLPSSWTSLYELTKADPAKLKAALKDGTITPDMKGREVKALLPPRKPKTPNGKPRETAGAFIDYSPSVECFLAVETLITTAMLDMDANEQRDLLSRMQQLVAQLETQVRRHTE